MVLTANSEDLTHRFFPGPSFCWRFEDDRRGPPVVRSPLFPRPASPAIRSFGRSLPLPSGYPGFLRCPLLRKSCPVGTTDEDTQELWGITPVYLSPAPIGASRLLGRPVSLTSAAAHTPADPPVECCPSCLVCVRFLNSLVRRTVGQCRCHRPFRCSVPISSPRVFYSPLPTPALPPREDSAALPVRTAE